MEQWNLLLGAHDHIWNDRMWPLKVRIDTCNLLRKKMLEVEFAPLPLIPVKVTTSAPDEDAAPLKSLHHSP